jgi:subtilisin family serine protease
MTQGERYKITSNEYLDLIIEYSSNMRVFERYPDATVHIISDRFAIVHVPVVQLTENIISQYGYSSLPALFGLTSELSLEASGVQRLRRIPAYNLRGRGILIGIIDTGIDYTNSLFQREDGTSKIAAIWDQTIESENQYPEGIFYGTEYRGEQINQALNSANPLDVVPSTDDNGHGTILAGIIAGNEDTENNFSGVVPDAELIVVKLKQAKQNIRDFFHIPEDVICYQENDLIWASRYIIDVARQLGRPLSLCIGLGTSQGSHDGRGALSTFLSLSGDLPGISVTVSAGNEGSMRRHFFSTIVPSTGYSTIELNVAEGEHGFSMELWGAAPTSYSIDILSPAGEYIPRITENLYLHRQISFIFETTVISIDYELMEALTGDQLILMRFQNPASGIYRFRVYGRGDLMGSFHVWLPMGNFISEDTFFMVANAFTTITTPGNAVVPITATAYNLDSMNLYPEASRGFTRINMAKPDIAAPGAGIVVPTLEKEFAVASGTGIAAAHVAGLAAMLLEWGIVREAYPGIDSVEIKKFLTRGAIRTEIYRYPNPDWGYGVVDIYNVFETLRANFQL